MERKYRVPIAIFIIMFCFAWMNAHATGSTKKSDPSQFVEVDQGQGQHQKQDQDQHQGQSQLQSQSSSSSADNTGNQQNVQFNAPEDVGNAFMSSGSSTSPCQKVRGLGSGWLGGALSLRWDATDKDCRRILIAERARLRGRDQFADHLICSTKSVENTFDYVPRRERYDECRDMLGVSTVQSQKNRDGERLYTMDQVREICARQGVQCGINK